MSAISPTTQSSHGRWIEGHGRWIEGPGGGLLPGCASATRPRRAARAAPPICHAGETVGHRARQCGFAVLTRVPLRLQASRHGNRKLRRRSIACMLPSAHTWPLNPPTPALNSPTPAVNPPMSALNPPTTCQSARVQGYLGPSRPLFEHHSSVPVRATMKAPRLLLLLLVGSALVSALGAWRRAGVSWEVFS